MSNRTKRVVDTALTLTLVVLASIVLLTVLVSQSGCSGVILTPTYSKLLDDTAAISTALANGADANQCSPADAKKALRWNADAWARFVSARDGKATTKPAGK